MPLVLPLVLTLLTACSAASHAAATHADTGPVGADAAVSRTFAPTPRTSAPDAPAAPAGLPHEELVAPAPAPTPARPTRLVAQDLDDGERGLRLEGTPALSADGRFVLTLARLDDWGNQGIVVHRARTGRVVRRIAWPRRFDHVEGAPGPIDALQVRRVRRFLRREGFVALPHLTWGPRKRPRGADTVAQYFVGEALRVAMVWPSEEDPRGELRVIADARVVTTREALAEEVGSVAVDPAGRFVVVASSFCGCHCTSGSTVVPLR